jgi:DNA-binding SARP family transcriptional activator/tetratricopeptide (TPR) repeat protein
MGVGVAEFRLLGPVEAGVPGRPVDLGTTKQRTVLAALLVDAGRPVAIETLIDRVWDHTPPARARNVLYAHLSRIRRLLPTLQNGDRTPAVLERYSGGYRLRIDPEQVDLHRFRRLMAAAQATDNDTARAAVLREATGLWLGDPLTGLAGKWAAGVRETLRQQRLNAVLRWAEVELRLGRASAVIDTLRPLLAEYPVVEPLTAQLMLALSADGRAAEALDCYATMRHRLVNELGIEPGPELQRIHQRILRGDLPGTTSAPALLDLAPPQTTLAQLPADLAGFTGRGEQLARLDALLSEHEFAAAATMVVVIGGPPGVGKTALALRWAHSVASRFGDGQLYVNLRGFDPSGPPMPPTEAVQGFLNAFGVPPERIPDEPSAQVGLYRSLLAAKRVLVVLDNARDVAQVHPLLPGSARCTVIVTSRNQISGLIAADGAHPLTLGELSAAEARELLARRLGADRVAAEPEAVDDIISGCARLPLALAIVAARAATHPWFQLQALAAELRTAHQRLNVFAGGDAATDVRAIFSSSYRLLSPAAARAFRLLGLYPGTDIASRAAARLVGVPVKEIGVLLAELARAHLVTEHTPGRFALHDLLRAYAAEQTHELDPADERHAALRRLLDHYLYTAHKAGRLLRPHRDALSLAPPPGTVERIADATQAMAWFTAEHQVLLAAVEMADISGFEAHAWKLTWALAAFLDRRGHWHDWAAVQHTALRAAQRLGGLTGEAYAHRSLAASYVRLRRCDKVHRLLLRALDLFGATGDRIGRAHTHSSLSWVLERMGRHHESLAQAEHALDLYREAGHRSGQAQAINMIGWSHALLGDYRQCLDHCQRALLLFEELGDRTGQAATWDSLGYAHYHLGHHKQAIASYQRCLDLRRDLADRYNEADALTHLGDAHLADAARTAWRRALEIFNETQPPRRETGPGATGPHRPGQGNPDPGRLPAATGM